MKGDFFITTPVYYANAQPHIGHAYTTIAADVLTRFKRLQKIDTFFLTGMDEHGAKIAQKAKEEGKSPQELVDEVAADFKNLWGELGIKYDCFTRTTDKWHKKAVQASLQKLYDEGIIYKGEYEGKYCVGCEQFKNDSDLVDGKCPDHDKDPELMKEESYMMKMGEKQEELIKKIKSDEFQIFPERYKNEILSFLENNKLEDLSISRKNISWGVPLSFDETHTSYVWFDAFLSYLTGLGWKGTKEELVVNDEKTLQFWPASMNLIGKDILRVHATIWPIMLMHLGIELPKQLFVHGHILSDGKKMSKTLGNVISIDEMIEKFGVDATRYLLLTAGTFGEDVDVTMERLVEKYNADLANGLGNLLSRVVTLSSNFKFEILNFNLSLDDQVLDDEIGEFVNDLKFDKALGYIWKRIQRSNKYIEETKPWELAKGDIDKFEEVMNELIVNLYEVAELVKSFMPETSEEIKKQLQTGEKKILFERIK